MSAQLRMADEHHRVDVDVSTTQNGRRATYKGRPNRKEYKCHGICDVMHPRTADENS